MVDDSLMRVINVTRFGLHAAAVLYTGGSVAQLLKLIYDFRWQDMPFVIDWAIVVLGSIGLATLAMQTRHIDYRGRWEWPIHFVIIAHLGVSIVLHLWTLYVQNHDLYAAFPPEYSYFALVYFMFFAWRSWTISIRDNGVAGNT